ncbi:MAG TPA: class I SAM-dependent methyltransferase [Myxococcota bacterium]|nr:class I SAM-dependent methyltransferase [Myxococcota bacterium]
MATPASGLLMYGELAPWWPLVSDPADYAEEAASFLKIFALEPAPARPALLELGSGGGNLASHLHGRFALTLCDLSRDMLHVSRAQNPGVEHVQGDMRTLRLARNFDCVLIHDAVMYLTSADDVRAALATAAAHCRPGGVLVVAPDVVRETFEAYTDHGGRDGADGRGARYLEWVSDPDPRDTTFETLYTLVLRDADGATRVELDRHVEGLFAEGEWLAWLREAGFDARVVGDAWGRRVFRGARR